MKRTTILILALTLVASAAVARPAGPGAPPSGAPVGTFGPGGPGAGPGGGDRLAEYLDLTTAQKEAWSAAREEFQSSNEGLREQMRAAHEQMKTLMDAGSTDAAAIGNVMITIRTLSNQIRTAHEALDAKLDATLTAEQKAKHAAFKAALEFLGGGRQGPPAGPRPGR